MLRQCLLFLLFFCCWMWLWAVWDDMAFVLETAESMPFSPSSEDELWFKTLCKDCVKGSQIKNLTYYQSLPDKSGLSCIKIETFVIFFWIFFGNSQLKSQGRENTSTATKKSCFKREKNLDFEIRKITHLPPSSGHRKYHSTGKLIERNMKKKIFQFYDGC